MLGAALFSHQLAVRRPLSRQWRLWSPIVGNGWQHCFCQCCAIFVVLSGGWQRLPCHVPFMHLVEDMARIAVPACTVSQGPLAWAWVLSWCLIAVHMTCSVHTCSFMFAVLFEQLLPAAASLMPCQCSPGCGQLSCIKYQISAASCLLLISRRSRCNRVCPKEALCVLAPQQATLHAHP